MPKFLFTPIAHDPYDTSGAIQYAQELRAQDSGLGLNPVLGTKAALASAFAGGASRLIGGIGSALGTVGNELMGQGGVELDARGAPTPVNPSLIDATNTLGGVVMEGGVAMPRPADSLGVFGGMNAKTANLDKLSAAMRMEQAGVHPDEVWRQTGWGKGKDGKWRFEIPDAFSSYDANVLKPFSKEYINDPESGTPRYKSEVEFRQSLDDYAKKQGYDRFYSMPDEEKTAARAFAHEQIGMKSTLGRVLDHPALYDAYPSLRDLPVKAHEEVHSAGVYDPGDNTIGVTPKGSQYGGVNGEDPHSVILHEVQHAIQSREGFGHGGSPTDNALAIPGERILSDALGRKMELVRKRSRDGILSPEDSEELFYLNAIIPKLGSVDSSSLGYHTLEGEVESRNVETRHRGFVRPTTPPWMTEDVPRRLQHTRVIPDWLKNVNEKKR